MAAKAPQYPRVTQHVRNVAKNRARVDSRAQYLPAFQQIDAQMRDIRRDRDYGINSLRLYGQEGDKRLAEAADWLNGVLSKQAGVTQGIYGAASDNIQSAYAGALGAQQSYGDQLLAQQQQRAAALGLMDATNDPSAELRGRILDAQSATQQDFANAFGNIEALGASESVRAQDIVGTAARQAFQERSDLGSEVALGISDTNRAAQEELFEGQRSRLDLRLQQGTTEQQLRTQHQKDIIDFQRQRFLDKLYRSVQMNTMKLQNAQLNLEKQTAKFNRQQGRAATSLAKKRFGLDKNVALQTLNLQRQQMLAQIAQANSPAARAAAQLNLQKLEADINFVKSKTTKNLAEAARKRNWRSGTGRKIKTSYTNKMSKSEFNAYMKKLAG